MDVSKVVDKLSGPIFNFRMATGLLGDLDKRKASPMPNDARLRKSATKRLANAQNAIEQIINEAAQDGDA